MTPQDKKKLDKLANLLRDAQMLLKEVLGDSEAPQPTGTGTKTAFDSVSCLARLRTLNREAAEALLADLKQHELGAIFVDAGGPQADRKKAESMAHRANPMASV